MERAQRDQMITEHVPLVQCIVGRVTTTLPPTVEREDLVSAGIMGLIKAVDRFDPGRGVKFETYASQLIRGEVMESLRARDWAPRGLRRKAREISAAIAGLQRTLKRPPDDAEIAEEIGMSVDEYHSVLARISGTTVLSLEEALQSGMQPGAEDGSEIIPPDTEGNPLEKLTRDEQMELVAQAVEALPERENLVLSLYYQDGLSLREIGEVLGVTESRVCQIHGQAVARLRASLMEQS